MSPMLGKLETLIGHKFRDLSLLERAVTHRSWAFENLTSLSDEEIREKENESLEFVGDSVLGLAIAELLFLRHPRLSEGDLTLMKHHLVSGSALATVAEDIGLGEFMRLGGSETRAGRKKQSLLANTLEALIGAVFFDGGYVATRLVVARLMDRQLKNVTPRGSIDFKSRLQTELQAQRMKTAEYRLVRTEGLPHARTFYVEVIWESGRASGHGSSIKAAEMVAASEALKQITSHTT